MSLPVAECAIRMFFTGGDGEKEGWEKAGSRSWTMKRRNRDCQGFVRRLPKNLEAGGFYSYRPDIFIESPVSRMKTGSEFNDRPLWIGSICTKTALKSFVVKR